MSGTATYLGFDYGTNKIGIAVGQELTATARDLDTIAVRNNQPDWDRIDHLLEEWAPNALVVGLPLNGDGGETQMSKRAREFGQSLAHRYNLPVSYVDEHLSSVAARENLKSMGFSSARREASLDREAARLILETFLNEQQRERSQSD